MIERFSSESPKLPSPDSSGSGGDGKKEKSSEGSGNPKKDGAVLVRSLIGEQAKAETARQHPLPVGELFVKRGPDALPEQDQERKKKRKRSKKRADARGEHSEPKAADEIAGTETADADPKDAETVDFPKPAVGEKKPAEAPASNPEDGKEKSHGTAGDGGENELDLHSDEPKLFHEIYLLPENKAYRGEVIVDLNGNKPPIIHEKPVAPEAETEAHLEPGSEPVEIPEVLAEEPAAADSAGEPEAEHPEPVAAVAAARPIPSGHESPAPPHGPVPLAGVGGGSPPSIPGGVPLSAEGPEPSPEPVSPTGTPEESAEPLMMPVAAAPRRLEPAEAFRMYAERNAADVPAASFPGEEMVTKQDAEKAAYYAERHGQSRGVLAGFVAAAWLARRRGKKLRRQFNETFNKQEKQHRQELQVQKIYSTEQAKRQAETTRRLEANEAQLAYTRQEQARQGNRQAHAEQVQMQTAERRDAELQAQRLQLQTREQRGIDPTQKQNGQTEQLNVPAEHRLQTSAWHTIEVDARTGKPVEQPTFAYGHEYYRERAHEARPADERNAATGEVALVAASVVRGGSSQGDGQAGNGNPLPPSNIPSATHQGPPSSTPRPSSTSGSPRGLISKATAGGPIWPYILAIAVIIICIAFLV